MANPLLVKAAVSAATSEKGRKIIAAIVCVILALIIVIVVLPLYIFSSIISGLFSFTANENHKEEWTFVMSRLEQTFWEVGAKFEKELKQEIYKFMPDFEANIEKANDKDYSEENKTYTYNISETRVESKLIRTQTLTVTTTTITEDDSTDPPTVTIDTYREIVQYRQIISAPLYAPEFFAMLQARQLTNTINENMSQDEYIELEKDLERALSALPESGEIPKDYSENAWKEIMKTEDLTELMSSFFSTKTEYDSGESYTKLTATLEISYTDELDKIFKLNDEQMKVAKENETLITQILDSVSVSQNNRNLSLDNILKGAFFYFGTFEEPLEISWLGAITSEFGYRVDPVNGGEDFHTGIDLAAPKGTNITAVMGGKVVFVSLGNTGYGHYVKLDHGNGTETLYAHCSEIFVEIGQEVDKGEVIAAVGSTGKSTGNHLHFEVRINGQAVNPRPYLP